MSPDRVRDFWLALEESYFPQPALLPASPVTPLSPLGVRKITRDLQRNVHHNDAEKNVFVSGIVWKPNPNPAGYMDFIFIFEDF